MGPQGMHRVINDFSARWPSLPFLSYGVWRAWSSLAYSGALWLSEGEPNGLSLSSMYVLSGLGCALVLLFAAVLGYRASRRTLEQSTKLLASRFARAHGRPAHLVLTRLGSAVSGFALVTDRAVRRAGAVAGLGCLLIVAAGPHYLGWFPLFVVGAVASGAGTAVVGLRCGALFGSVPPRKSLVYVGLSQLATVFIYLVVMACPVWAPVPHGPSLAGIAAFCLLPCVAALLSCMPLSKEPGDTLDQGRPSVSGRLPRTFWGCVVAIFVMAATTSMVRGGVVATHDLVSTVNGNGLLTLLTIFMAAACIGYGMLSTVHPYAMGKLASVLATVAAMATVCAGAIGGLGLPVSLVVQFCAKVFSMLIWCLLAFVVAQKRVPAVVVFGVGEGVYMIGRTLGWMAGAYLVPFFSDGTATALFFLVLAAVTLVAVLGCFSERSYALLFSPLNEEELSLEDLFAMGPREQQGAETAQRTEKRGRFSCAIETLTAEYGLSAREAEVLRCLAMGYGGDRVAQTMGVKVNTVRVHTRNVYVKLGVHSRDELMKLVDEVIARI